MFESDFNNFKNRVTIRLGESMDVFYYEDIKDGF